MTIRGVFCWGGTAALLLAAACEPAPPEGTGGVTVDELFGADGRSCGRGIAVVMTDYVSANVALVGLDGETLSGSFISSASGGPSLNQPLGSDVVFPSSRMSRDIVLIDRFPASVMTFVEPETAEVTGQASVRTGFDANPQDAVITGQGDLLVSRFEKNRDPGPLSFDQGDDIVRVDRNTVLGRIDLSDYVGVTTERARPGTMVRNGEHIFVSLARHDAAFDDAGEGAVLVLDGSSGEPLEAFPVVGMKNCVGLALSPDQTHLAVSCSGLVDASNAARPDHSGIVILNVSPDEEGAPQARESFRLDAKDVGLGPFAPSLGYASANSLWVSTYGALEGDDAGRPDRKLAVDLETGDYEVLLESAETAFSLGDIECINACGVCFIADAGREVVHRYSLSGSAISSVTAHEIENEIGLPPRYLGWF